MSVSPHASRDERLAQLIEQLSMEQRAGRPASLEQACRSDPDLAVELKELWAVAQFAGLARKPTSVLPRTVASISDPTTTSAAGGNRMSLPRAFGDFELTEELGRGGMGVVYKARQKSLNRLVALKMVREAHLATADDRARFRIEAEAAARLKHANIVTVYEFDTVDGQAFFCMEYVDGDTLDEKVKAEGPFPPREAARLVAVLARAVQHAHSLGILHRDLKPSNILLGARSSGRSAAVDSEPLFTSNPLPFAEDLKITDFGLAKRLDQTGSLTRTGAIVGTPSYMPPEQAGGRKDLTPASDVYSLGAILYELLTGRPPFQASHPVDTLLLVLEQEPIPPRDLNPTVDRELELVCLKCLQKPIELRYQSAAALASDLEAYAAGEPISDQPSGLRFFLARLFRETHHAEVLENWGKLWMWHSLMLFLLCLLTQVMAWMRVTSHLAFLGVWSVGLVTWGSIVWKLRRRAGPVLFVERQIAHAWAAGVCASIGMFIIEVIADLPVLTLSPTLAIAAGMVFVFTAGILSGQFYVWAMVNFAAASVMAAFPAVAHLVFGLASAVSFFVPGLKYYRQRKRTVARQITRDSAMDRNRRD